MMKSPSRMSALIRAKKRRMQEDPDVIDSGDSPHMDLQDEEIARLQEANDAHNMNHPMERPDAYNEDPESERREEEDQAPHADRAPMSKETRMMARGGFVDPDDDKRMQVDGDSSDEHERSSMDADYAANEYPDAPGQDDHEEQSLHEAREEGQDAEQFLAQGGLIDPNDRSNPRHNDESSDEQEEASQGDYERLALGGYAKGGMPKLGSGARFAAVERHAAASGARDPAAVAAAAGRAKYGAKRMAKMAAAHRADGGIMAVPAFHGVAQAAPETHEEAVKRRKIRIARMLSQ